MPHTTRLCGNSDDNRASVEIYRLNHGSLCTYDSSRRNAREMEFPKHARLDTFAFNAIIRWDETESKQAME